jgi:hypothetical protein
MLHGLQSEPRADATFFEAFPVILHAQFQETGGPQETDNHIYGAAVLDGVVQGCRSPWYIPHLGVEFTKVIPPGRFHGNSPTLLPR